LEGCDYRVSVRVKPRSPGLSMVRERSLSRVVYRSIGHVAGTTFRSGPGIGVGSFAL